ncbi:GNAT family N-acetyltransferase [Intrasporangium sp.]|uniref:GNAT family N-acetyltransferase n=1 Tax=Intrasporangium sp. TaxID=1925024 RepID=UPI00322187B5
MPRHTAQASYTTRPLTTDTWGDFAALVEANNGVWGGCWCMGFHPAGFSGGSAEANRENKRALVQRGEVRQILVYDDEQCVGWCQFGTPTDLPNIKNPRAYDKDLDTLPDWRIGCVFTGKGHRRAGVARAAVSGVLEAVAAAGGGVVEAYPEQVESRAPQQGAYFHTGPESLFAELGFERCRRIAKWRWVMRRHVVPDPDARPG